MSRPTSSGTTKPGIEASPVPSRPVGCAVLARPNPKVGWRVGPVGCSAVFTRPDDLSDSMLTSHVVEGWQIAVDRVDYVAVGFGSHHWSAHAGDRRWFVTVDDLDAKKHSITDGRDAVFRRLRAALSAARVIADRGLEFVVAPARAVDGSVVRHVEDRYAAAVYPFIDGTSYPYGDFPTVEHRDAVLEMLARLHGVDHPATTGAARDDLVVPRRADYQEAIDGLGRRWDCGPFGELARGVLDRYASAVERSFHHYDRIAARMAYRSERTVLTHGEPHPANTVMTNDGWLLLDWDTTLIAAPERDLWMMATVDPSVVDSYESIAGRQVLREGLDCYRLWWDLSEICGYVTLLHGTHHDTADVRQSWTNLQHFLESAARRAD